MSQASQRAAHIRKKYGLSTPVDLDVIVEGENLELTPFPLKGRVQEIISGASFPYYLWKPCLSPYADLFGDHCLKLGEAGEISVSYPGCLNGNLALLQRGLPPMIYHPIMG